MAEEKKKEEAPCCGGDGNMLYLWAVGGLIVGLILGYIVFPGMAPASSAGGVTVIGGNTSTAFTLDQAKVSQVGGFLQNYYFVSTGEETTAAFTRYVDKGAYVELYYDVAGQEMPVLMSKDYNYFYAGAYDFGATVSQMELARQQAGDASASQAQGIPQSSNPQVLMFVMSYCPYGNQAETGLAPVIDLLADSATFEPVYIIYPDGRECAENEGAKYCSLHGNAELWQDVREKIIFSMYGERKWAEYVSKANADCTLDNIDTCWVTAADAVGGINASAVAAEFEASKFDILASELEKTNTYMVSGSPTIMINGGSYGGARTPESYKQAICGAFTDAPAGCNDTLDSTAVASTGSC